MKPALFWPLTALLGSAIVILVLNLLERDVYEHGELAPPSPGNNVPDDDVLFARLFPREFVHRCATCGDCRHPLEILENRRLISLRDHDGWYRLLWAAEETYHYEDPVYLAESLQNPSARDPEGTWTIRARVGPAAHPLLPAHACGEVPGQIHHVYTFFASEPSIAETGAQVQVLTYRCRAGHLPPVLHFGWRIAGRLEMLAAPCPCGKP